MFKGIGKFIEGFIIGILVWSTFFSVIEFKFNIIITLIILVGCYSTMYIIYKREKEGYVVPDEVSMSWF